MALPASSIRIRPDVLTVWPTEYGTFGLDARWGGPEGFAQANAIRDAASSGGLPVKLIQEVGGQGWSVRVGPLERGETLKVIETFLT